MAEAITTKCKGCENPINIALAAVDLCEDCTALAGEPETRNVVGALIAERYQVPSVAGDPTRAAFIAGLHNLALWFAEHADFPTPEIMTIVAHVPDLETLRAVAERLGRPVYKERQVSVWERFEGIPYLSLLVSIERGREAPL